MNVIADDPDDTIDLRAIAAHLWYRWRWITAGVILLTGIFAAVAFVTTPVYRSTAVFVPATPDRASMSNLLGGTLGSLGDLASLAGVNLGSSSTETEEALAVLRSRQFTEAFIQDRQLIPELFPGKWDSQGQQWRTGVVPPTPAQAYKYFNNSIRSIIEDKKTGLLTLQIDWRDRAEAAAWANELLRRVNAEMRSRAIRKADASVGYLEKELATTTEVATRDAISRLIEAQIKQRMLADVTEEYVFRVVDRAMPADKFDVLRPKKLLMIVAGFALGAVLSVGVVLLLDGVGRKRAVANRRV